ncbi:MAG: hypothetical protein GXO91_04030 [FCB group bacterium]|nr:hypothetical protein [FCB group bacterium]
MMTVKLLLFNCLLLGTVFAFTPAESADVLQQGERTLGVFQPLRLGVGHELELTTHPLLFFLMPNLTVQKYLGEVEGWHLASRNHAAYPTLLLRAVQKNGIAGIIAPDPDIQKIPQLLYWRSEIRISRKFQRSLLTLKTGLALGLGGTKMDERLWIDYPMVFHRMGVLFNGWGLNMGADFRYRLTSKTDILVDGDLFTLPGSKYAGFFEHKAVVTWYKWKKIQLSAGYKLSHGKYPYGSQWYLVPLLDMTWQWQ